LGAGPTPGAGGTSRARGPGRFCTRWVGRARHAESAADEARARMEGGVDGDVGRRRGRGHADDGGRRVHGAEEGYPRWVHWPVGCAGMAGR
jgi:hypothetical protein